MSLYYIFSQSNQSWALFRWNRLPLLPFLILINWKLAWLATWSGLNFLFMIIWRLTRSLRSTQHISQESHSTWYVIKHPFLLSLDLCFGMQKVRWHGIFWADQWETEVQWWPAPWGFPESVWSFRKMIVPRYENFIFL